MAWKDQEKKKEYDRKWKKKNRKKLNEYQSEWRKTSDAYVKWVRNYLDSGRFYENRDKYRKTAKGKAMERKAMLKAKHRISPEIFNSLLESQDNACAICRGKNWTKHGPAVDHDHKSGAIRGILCYRCNLALGLMKDNPATIMSAFLYVTSNREDGENEREKSK